MEKVKVTFVGFWHSLSALGTTLFGQWWLFSLANILTPLYVINVCVWLSPLILKKLFFRNHYKYQTHTTHSLSYTFKSLSTCDRKSVFFLSSLTPKPQFWQPKPQNPKIFYDQAQLQETSNQTELQRKMFEVEHLIYNQWCSQYKST